MGSNHKVYFKDSNYFICFGVFASYANYCRLDILFVALTNFLKHFLNSWFLCFSFLFVAHQVLQWILGVHLRWIDSYLDPILMMPITLHIILWERRYLFHKTVDYKLSSSDIFNYFLLVSILGEVVFPALQPRFVADWMDVLCYLIGAVFFYFFMNGRKL